MKKIGLFEFFNIENRVFVFLDEVFIVELYSENYLDFLKNEVLIFNLIKEKYISYNDVCFSFFYNKKRNQLENDFFHKYDNVLKVKWEQLFNKNKIKEVHFLI